MSDNVLQEIPKIFTKKLRSEIISNGRGKSEDEKFQKDYLEKHLGVQIKKKKDIRVNIDSGEIKIVKSSMQELDPSVWSEDFDGVFTKNGKECVVSFKMIPENGGSQNRSIKEVYWHIKACIKSVSLDNKIKVDKFLFILDGELLSKHWQRMNDLIPQELKEKFYIGPLKEATANV